MPIAFARRPGLVVYLTAGDPDLATSREAALAAIDAGADVLELGVPFSDPVADGPVIQRASERALAAGTRLKDVLALARQLRRARPAAGLVIFSYFNPVLRYGLEAFTREAAEAGVDGVLITDLIVEEAADYLDHMLRAGLAPVFLAAPTSPDERLEQIAAHSRGFVYAISRTGVTGTEQALAAEAETLVARIRRFTSLPVVVGFGISTAAHVAEVGRFADAAVVGSAVVAAIEASPPGQAAERVAALLTRLRAPDGGSAGGFPL